MINRLSFCIKMLGFTKISSLGVMKSKRHYECKWKYKVNYMCKLRYNNIFCRLKLNAFLYFVFLASGFLEQASFDSGFAIISGFSLNMVDNFEP